MNANDKQDVKAIARQVVAESLLQIESKGDLDTPVMSEDLGSEAYRLEHYEENVAKRAAEAARLTPDKAGQDFEGVKYVVGACGRTWRVISEAVYLKERYTSDYTDEASPVFLMLPDGETGWDAPRHLTPWHPKKGDEVRDDNVPSRVGVVAKVTIPGQTYYVDWRDGGSYHYGLAHLRPFSFAPDDAQAEKQEFEEGTLVVDDGTGWLRVAAHRGRYLDLEGDARSLFGKARPAKVSDVASYAKEEAGLLTRGLRIHARQLAKETK